MHAVVGHARLLAHHGDVQSPIADHAHELHDEIMADWAVADHDDTLAVELQSRARFNLSGQAGRLRL
eukprot:4097358-Pyramimonas_sp.AAC.1